eukprot:2908190-Pleurochrysis_carterae.AAC.1
MRSSYPPANLRTSSKPQAYLPTYLATCLSTCLSAYLPAELACQQAHLHDSSLPGYEYPCLALRPQASTGLTTCLPVYLSTYVPIYMSARLLTCPSYLHAHLSPRVRLRSPSYTRAHASKHKCTQVHVRAFMHPCADAH